MKEYLSNIKKAVSVLQMEILHYNYYLLDSSPANIVTIFIESIAMLCH